MSESQAIPWKQLAAEAVAIVASILLAFWIDAWWDGSKDRQEEHEILIGQYLSDSVDEMDLRSIEILAMIREQLAMFGT